MFIQNGKVRCVGYNRGERYFSVGRVYDVIDNTIVNDNGYKYDIRNIRGESNVLEYLSDWYQFEVVITDERIVCDICGEEISADKVIYVDGKYICDSCKDDNVYFCDCCGRTVLEENSHYIDEQTICNRCFERSYEPCAECGEMVYRYDMHMTHDGNRVCESCADYCYRTCENCGGLVHEDDIYYDSNDNCYCENCYNELRSKVIHNYYYKPIPIFHGSSYSNATFPMYMGVELEIDNAGEDGENAQILLDIANANAEHIYCKHDGSLSEGFEIVSHPATLDYHLSDIAWREVMEEALSMGYRSHDTDTCGLHVHVSRRALGDTFEQEEETISKILYFIENNWDDMLRFTRRTRRNLEHWASRYGLEESVEKTYKKAKGDFSRYRCLNLQNDNTIEFRMFRGTLKHETFVSTLQLVHEICRVCKVCTMERITTLDWNSFMEWIDPTIHGELIEYCKNRDLYNVNA